MNKPPVSLLTVFDDTLIGTGTALALIAHLVALIEIAEWLITGQWPGWSLADGLIFVGIEKPLAQFDLTQLLVDIAIDLPLAIVLYFAGLAIFFAALDMPPSRP